jgi:hypothetical protein
MTSHSDDLATSMTTGAPHAFEVHRWPAVTDAAPIATFEDREAAFAFARKAAIARKADVLVRGPAPDPNPVTAYDF